MGLGAQLVPAFSEAHRYKLNVAAVFKAGKWIWASDYLGRFSGAQIIIYCRCHFYSGIGTGGSACRHLFRGAQIWTRMSPPFLQLKWGTGGSACRCLFKSAQVWTECCRRFCGTQVKIQFRGHSGIGTGGTYCRRLFRGAQGTGMNFMYQMYLTVSP